MKLTTGGEQERAKKRPHPSVGAASSAVEPVDQASVKKRKNNPMRNGQPRKFF